jgi:predicted Zn-dependent protease
MNTPFNWQTIKDNEFNIERDDRIIGDIVGCYAYSNAHCIFYQNLRQHYSSYLNKRAGRVAAHEMGHTGKINGTLPWSHHSDCVMESDTAANIDGASAYFYGNCKRKWIKLLGE